MSNPKGINQYTGGTKASRAQPRSLVNRATPAMLKQAAARKKNGGGSKAQVDAWLKRATKK